MEAIDSFAAGTFGGKGKVRQRGEERGEGSLQGRALPC
jgi:hypothetical protein